ncbi:6-carboxytetrahydropterin synthase [Lamprobacter modestohalophilus]|uniref:6-pyruvoyl trahydropterin synthase family protein n=1 Tax=Lamprobacter modestohalophilus TaxID=1064514 RepID=UPI002ADED279|nr:6-carboxytetrahydropterin synthase [Lamprobacter modestohalophilus]MEA1051997.1 6-carboxytetrahydropterin synthase [Lamprobacter modestohalophilus]
MSERLFHKAAAGFEAARRLPTLPLGHQEQRLHGHSFKARVLAELPAGWGGFDGAETDALADALRGAIEALDYRDLNQQLELPSDEHLAAWVQRQLMDVRGVPGIAQVGVQSTSEQGVELGRVFPEFGPESKPVSTDTTGVDATRTDATSADPAGSDAVAGDEVRKIHVWRRFRFEAAHRLVNVPPDHQCGRMHGHGFEVILHAQQRFGGPSDGLAEKTASSGSHYDQLGAIWSPLHAELDHRCLNDLPGLENPTSELLAFWIWQRLKAVLPELSLVSVYETATAGCHYDGREYRIWKELRFEGALRFSKAPAPDARRRLHGHSYLLRLHLTAPLDEVLGWTVDYGDVKALFKPIYAQLDHHELNGLPQLADPSAAGIARWIRRAVADVLPQADRLELTERPGCGVLLCWGASVPRREVTVLPL